MAQVVSFKAPKEMVREIDEFVRAGNYLSRGEFLRALVRSIIETKELSEEAKKSIEKARKQKDIPLDEPFP